MYYCILQKTPHLGYWEQLPNWQIQKAERALRIGTFYHERAQKVGKLYRPLYLYSMDDCIAIIQFWQERHDWAEYKVIGYPFEVKQ